MLWCSLVEFQKRYRNPNPNPDPGWRPETQRHPLTCPPLLIFSGEVDLFAVRVLLRQAHQPLRREELALARALVEGSAPTEVSCRHVGAALVEVLQQLQVAVLCCKKGASAVAHALGLWARSVGGRDGMGSCVSEFDGTIRRP